MQTKKSKLMEFKEWLMGRIEDGKKESASDYTTGYVNALNKTGHIVDSDAIIYVVSRWSKGEIDYPTAYYLIHGHSRDQPCNDKED